MNTQEALRQSLEMSHFIMTSYLSDLSDAELLMRPVENSNHPAWQLGHLIVSEYSIMEGVKPGSSPALPSGFSECYKKECSSGNDPKKFHTKDQYLEIYNRQRNASLQLLETMSDSDLDKPGPEEMRSYCPTIGAAFILLSSHETMHAGQLAVLRRKLGKKILM